jgi:hypothetical protein
MTKTLMISSLLTRYNTELFTDPTPIGRPQYRTPFTLHDKTNSQVMDMLKNGSFGRTSLLGSLGDTCPKKRLDGKPKFRFCVEFGDLHPATKFDSYTLRHLEDSISSLFGSKYFSILDCYSGFCRSILLKITNN